MLQLELMEKLQLYCHKQLSPYYKVVVQHLQEIAIEAIDTLLDIGVSHMLLHLIYIMGTILFLYLNILVNCIFSSVYICFLTLK